MLHAKRVVLHAKRVCDKTAKRRDEFWSTEMLYFSVSQSLCLWVDNTTISLVPLKIAGAGRYMCSLGIMCLNPKCCLHMCMWEEVALPHLLFPYGARAINSLWPKGRRCFLQTWAVDIDMHTVYCNVAPAASISFLAVYNQSETLIEP